MGGQSEASSPQKKKAHNAFWYRFATQGFAGHNTVFSLHFAIYIFGVLAVLLLVGGAILLSESLKQVQVWARYDNEGPMAGISNAARQQKLLDEGSVNHVITLTVPRRMEPPVNVYYILKDFYQNHKRYVRSVSYPQLHGKTQSPGQLTDCIPQRFLGGTQNATFPEDGLINPCGLVAWSYFNDSFTSFAVSGDAGGVEPLAVDSSKLVWESDRDTFFGNYAAVNHNTIPEMRGGQQLTQNVSRDEHFMKWMKLSAHPDVRKFWGKIDRELQEGEVITINVTNAYNTYSFGGEKRILLTTQNSFGNRNTTFGIAWLIMGSCCCVIVGAYIFFGRQRLKLTRSVESKREFLKNKLSWKPKSGFLGDI